MPYQISESFLHEMKLLEEFDTPTIVNSIERFNMRSRLEGYSNPEIKEILPNDRTYIGIACTAKISSAAPANFDTDQVTRGYFDSLAESTAPTISVIEDVDPEIRGSFWGEVNVSAHRALGCLGVVTNGGVRDLKEVSATNFGYFASCVLISHGYVHIKESHIPVTVGGLLIKPGDLIAVDQHGVVNIPHEIVLELVAACRLTASAESPVLEGCRKALLAGKKITVDELIGWREKMYQSRNVDTF